MPFVLMNSAIREGFFTTKHPVKVGMCVAEAVNTGGSVRIDREKKKILLPYTPKWNIEWITYLTPTSILWRCSRSGQIFFCGEDSGFPFATPLKRAALTIYRHGGWPRLERAMVPPDIRKLAKSLGRNWQRSGDIFFLELAETFENALSLAGIAPSMRVGPLTFILTVDDVDKQPLFSTSHRLSGKSCGYFGDDILAAIGTLTAPDHPPVEMKKVCLFAPNALVDYRTNAD